MSGLTKAVWAERPDLSALRALNNVSYRSQGALAQA